MGIVGALLAFDLGILHKSDKEIGVAESLKLSAFYIAVAIIFGAWVWWSMGPTSGMQYFTGYALEKALSIDNVFVISIIFGYFAIPAKYQYRALLWGILAVLIMRGIMIALRRGPRPAVRVGALHLRRLPDRHGDQDARR